MDYFKRLPESLYDEILQFNEIPEIVKFSTTSLFHKEIVRRITINNCTKVQQLYNTQTPTTDIETWLFCPNHLYIMKNTKLFMKIYKEYNDFLLPEFQRVFTSFIQLYQFNENESYMFELCYVHKKRMEIPNCNIAIILFSITKNNINLFTVDLNQENIKFFRVVMKMLFQIYSSQSDEPLNIRDDLLSMLKKIIYDLINFLKQYDDLEDCFVMEVIQDILFYNEYNEHIKIFHNFLETVIANNNLGYYFVTAETGLSSHENFGERYSDY